MDLKIPVNPEILKVISRIDQFRSIWAGGTSVSPEQLATMRETARVQSVAASCRIAGIRVSEADVAAVLADGTALAAESAELAGYAAATDRSFPAAGPIVGARLPTAGTYGWRPQARAPFPRTFRDR